MGYIRGGTRVGLATIAEELKGIGTIRVTCNQQVMISDIPAAKRASVEHVLSKYGLLRDMKADAKKMAQDDGDDGSQISTESD
mmetsp:Transcript_134204/g.287010  ORF Transcript_134204/g.287010 Transcript_134204/m.287010 type:complete len:83 (-) Transcript_134204:17-265(-)